MFVKSKNVCNRLIKSPVLWTVSVIVSWFCRCM